MDQLLIYISYDQYEYTNYFRLAMNHEAVIEYCPEEEADRLFNIIIEKECVNKRFQLDVVQDENASKWDYLKVFREYGIEIRQINNPDMEQLCREVNTVFDGGDGIGGKDDIPNKKPISVLYSGNCTLQKDNCKTGEALKQADRKSVV